MTNDNLDDLGHRSSLAPKVATPRESIAISDNDNDVSEENDESTKQRRPTIDPKTMPMKIFLALMTRKLSSDRSNTDDRCVRDGDEIVKR